MDLEVSLFSMTSVHDQKAGTICIWALNEALNPTQIADVHTSALNSSTDFAALRFIQEQSLGWNKGLGVSVNVSPDTFVSEDHFQKWLVEVEKTQALIDGQLLVLVQSIVNREWFHERSNDLKKLQKCGVEIGLDVMGGMADANAWKDAFPWEAIQLNLNNCRGEFSQFVVFTSQMHMQGRKNLVIDVHDRSELITMEQVYVDYASGPVFGDSCLWSGPLSKSN